MYTDILLDADDTLLDFKKAQLYGFKSVLEFYGQPFSEALYARYKCINHQLWRDFEAGHLEKKEVQNKRFVLFFNSIDIEVNGEEADFCFQNSLQQQTWLMPHAEEVCRNLSQTCTLTIITNGVGHTQHKRIQTSAIAPYIHMVVVSEDLGVAKPEKAFFERALNLIGRPARKDILVVGDSLFSDIQGANNAGIDACWYNPGNELPPEGMTIRHTISDLRQLTKIIAENNSDKPSVHKI